MTTLPLNFTARVISGSGRGRKLGVPTLNLDLRDVPHDMPEGVYACRAVVNGIHYPAAAHYGPRPTFADAPSFEVHLIGASLPAPPGRIEVEIAALLRGISKFDSPEAMTEQIREDIQKTKEILL